MSKKTKHMAEMKKCGKGPGTAEGLGLLSLGNQRQQGEQMWLYRLEIPSFGRRGWEDQGFRAILGYTVS